MLEFPNRYFQDEEIEGFMVDKTMKTVWAAELEVLNEIAVICARHGLQWYAAYGTLLGAVRHEGFIPWDDDIDIWMKREDYRKLLEVLYEELPNGYEIRSPHAREGYPEYQVYINNCESVCIEPEHLQNFHGCPFSVGIDIFPLDIIPAEQKRRDMQRSVFSSALMLQKLDYEGKQTGQDTAECEKLLEETLEQISRLADMLQKEYGICIERHVLNGASREELLAVLWQAAEQLSYEAGKPAGHQLAMYLDYLKFGKVYEADWFGEEDYLPFEGFDFPVPGNYDAVLRAIYGDYSVCVRSSALHDYPCYKGQIEVLERLLEANNRKAGEKADLKFSKEFFEEEVRDDFVIDASMKCYWAAGLEMLQELDIICKRHHLQWYAANGTLLGTVRDNGFIPWEDDIAIWMKRGDFNQLLGMTAEFPKGYHLKSALTNVSCEQYHACLTNAECMSDDTERLMKYHGCPFVVNMNIYPLDYLPKNEQEREGQLSLLRIIAWAVHLIEREGRTQEDRKLLLDALEKIEQICGVTLRKELIETQEKGLLISSLYKLLNQLTSCYGEEDGDELVMYMDYLKAPDRCYPKEWFAESISLPFENTYIQCPKEYDEILRLLYKHNHVKIRTKKNYSPAYLEQMQELRTAGLEWEQKAVRLEENIKANNKPGSSGKHYHIMTSCDENLMNQVCVLLYSIGKNLEEAKVDFYLFHRSEEQVKLEGYQRILKIAQCFSQITFHSVVVSDVEQYDYLASLGGGWAGEAYYSLCAHQYLPEHVDRVLYLDAGDVIVHADIADFYYADFEDKILRAGNVRRYEGKVPVIYQEEDISDTDKLKDILDSTFNSGSYLLNLDKLREAQLEIKDYVDTADYIRELVGESDLPLYFGDQGFLSFCFLGDIQYWGQPEKEMLMTSKYNFMMGYYNIIEKMAKPPYVPAIIHFVGGPKPWMLEYPMKMKLITEPAKKATLEERILGQAEWYYLWHEYVLMVEKLLGL